MFSKFYQTRQNDTHINKCHQSMDGSETKSVSKSKTMRFICEWNENSSGLIS